MIRAKEARAAKDVGLVCPCSGALPMPDAQALRAVVLDVQRLARCFDEAKAIVRVLLSRSADGRRKMQALLSHD